MVQSTDSEVRQNYISESVSSVCSWAWPFTLSSSYFIRKTGSSQNFLSLRVIIAIHWTNCIEYWLLGADRALLLNEMTVKAYKNPPHRALPPPHCPKKERVCHKALGLCKLWWHFTIKALRKICSKVVQYNHVIQKECRTIVKYSSYLYLLN